MSSCYSLRISGVGKRVRDGIGSSSVVPTQSSDRRKVWIAATALSASIWRSWKPWQLTLQVVEHATHQNDRFEGQLESLNLIRRMQGGEV